MKTFGLVLSMAGCFLLLPINSAHSSERIFVETVNGVSFRMVEIPGGSFIMGSNHDMPNEKPAHHVNIKPFIMAETETTWALYEQCVNAGKCDDKIDIGWGKGDRPVNYMDWNGITHKFLPWLNQYTGKQYRLPSEAEWEYAARAGSATNYSWGDNINCNQAQYGRRRGGECSNREEGSAHVKSFSPNAFGLYDMHGNVAEWVQDCFNGDYHGAPTNGVAWKTGHCEASLQRGGTMYTMPSRVRSAMRSPNDHTNHGPSSGFRLAHDKSKLLAVTVSAKQDTSHQSRTLREEQAAEFDQFLSGSSYIRITNADVKYLEGYALDGDDGYSLSLKRINKAKPENWKVERNLRQYWYMQHLSGMRYRIITDLKVSPMALSAIQGAGGSYLTLEAPEDHPGQYWYFNINNDVKVLIRNELLGDDLALTGGWENKSVYMSKEGNYINQRWSFNGLIERDAVYHPNPFNLGEYSIASAKTNRGLCFKLGVSGGDIAISVFATCLNNHKDLFRIKPHFDGKSYALVLQDDKGKNVYLNSSLETISEADVVDLEAQKLLWQFTFDGKYGPDTYRISNKASPSLALTENSLMREKNLNVQLKRFDNRREQIWLFRQ